MRDETIRKRIVIDSWFYGKPVYFDTIEDALKFVGQALYEGTWVMARVVPVDDEGFEESECFEHDYDMSVNYPEWEKFRLYDYD